MSKIEEMYYRGDPKWAHPELAEMYKRLNMEAPVAADTYLNTEKYTFEERKEMVRKMNERLLTAYPVPTDLGRETYWADGCEEEPDAPKVEITVAYPEKRRKSKMPCLVYFTGGGLYYCPAWMTPMESFANHLNAVVVIMNYRTVYNGGGYPQTVNDCQAVYKWLVEHAEQIHINPDKIVFWGLSSGSQLAMALCHRLKKYNYYGYEPRGVIASAAITDDRVNYSCSKLSSYGWTGRDLAASAKIWLGELAPDPVPADAFPNRATAEECIGLPPTFIHCDEHDASSVANEAYASKLVEAGVYTEFHLWGGSNHAILGVEHETYDSDYLRRYMDIIYNNAKDCFKYDLRRQWITEK